jgi:hypothetical protein
MQLRLRAASLERARSDGSALGSPICSSLRTPEVRADVSPMQNGASVLVERSPVLRLSAQAHQLQVVDDNQTEVAVLRFATGQADRRQGREGHQRGGSRVEAGKTSNEADDRPDDKHRQDHDGTPNLGGCLTAGAPW